MKSAPEPKKKLSDYADNAFSMQTIEAADENESMRYVKSDVQNAKTAYDAFLSSKNLETLLELLNKVTICVQNNRDGFKEFEHALKQVQSSAFPEIKKNSSSPKPR